MFGKALATPFKRGLPGSGISFDASSGQLDNGRRTVRLEPRASAVLACLNDADGGLVSRQELLDRCWGVGEGSDEALTQAIAQVRRALEDLGARRSIETLAKRGYRLSAPFESAEAKESGRVRPAALIAIVLIALLALALLQPHGLLHFIRHNFGAGFS